MDVGLAANLILWGRGLCIYIPQWQRSGPVIPLCTGFTFRRVKVKVILRLTVSRPACLGVRHPTGTPRTISLLFNLSLGSCGFVDVGPLWREVESVVYSYRWASLAQSFLGPSPAGFMTIFHYLMRLPQPGGPGSCIYFPPGTRYPSYNPRQRVPYSSPSMTRRATMEVF
jgi:hypothetical protein